MTKEEKELRLFLRRTRKPVSNFGQRRPVVIKPNGERYTVATQTVAAPEGTTSVVRLVRS
jgi:hypothetical protein